MNFGEKLKQLRSARDLTQPELAEMMGIEQSYLSKLENDKSVPSNDVFNRILSTFDTDIEALTAGLDQGARYQLRQIPDVANYFGQLNRQIISNRKRWLLSSAFLLSFGAAFVFAGNVHMFFTDVLYQYKSHGVVLAGEPKEIFGNPHQFINRSARAENPDLVLEQMDAITARTDEVFLLASNHRGNIFNEPVEGGSRTYYFVGETAVDPRQSKFIVFAGVFMLMFGVTGIFLERRLSGASR